MFAGKLFDNELNELKMDAEKVLQSGIMHGGRVTIKPIKRTSALI